MKARYREILCGLLECPTAPFAESAVIDYVRRWAADRPVKVAQDRAGNLLISYRMAAGRRGHGPRDTVVATGGTPVGRMGETPMPRDTAALGYAIPHWIFAAHMDHPGFVVTGRRGRELRAEFRGTVDLKYFAGARVRFFLGAASEKQWAAGLLTRRPRIGAGFEAGRETRLAELGSRTGCVRGTVISARKTKQSPFLQCRIRLDEPARGPAGQPVSRSVAARERFAGRTRDSFPAVPVGAIGMWDFPGMRLSGNRISSRCCDDVAGCAAVLCAMEEIIASASPARVTAVLTRAEEAAFIGAMAACDEKSLPADGLIVAIETSKAHATARLGEGVIVRVGDRARTFDPSLTAHVAAVAQRLAARERSFRFSRQLMSGGTCESTAYAMFGYQATGLCVPLGNYHNQGPGEKVAPEQIDARDFECLVKLLAALPADASSPRQTDQALLDRLRVA